MQCASVLTRVKSSLSKLLVAAIVTCAVHGEKHDVGPDPDNGGLVLWVASEGRVAADSAAHDDVPCGEWLVPWEARVMVCWATEA